MSQMKVRAMAVGMRKGLLVSIAFLTFASGRANAACEWTWDCSTGTCRQIPLCDSTLDLPPLRPPEIAPIPSPSIKPLHRPVLPPLGTRSCDEKYLCNGFSCRWQTVCE